MPIQQLFNLLMLSVLWGGSFLFIGIAVREVEPLLLVFLRVSLASMVMLVLLKIVKQRLPNTLKSWGPYLVMGLINNVIPFTLIFYAQTLISVSLASIINAMTPICTFLVLAAFGEELMQRHKLIGSLVGVAGVAMLSGAAQSALNTDPIGIALSLAATLSYGFSGLWAKRHLAGRNSVQSATCQMISSSGIMLPLLFIFSVNIPSELPSMPVITSILALASVSTALAYIIFFELITKAGAANAMLVTLLVPISGSVLGHFVMNDSLHLYQVGGALLIGLGLLVIDGRITQKILASKIRQDS